jgi:glycosyltransferase involved in cell wall biosynthesis
MKVHRSPEELDYLGQAYGSNNMVRFSGPERSSKVLRAAGIVVLPFATGTAENKTSLLAALVNGAVVLTTEGDSTPSYLKNGENAMLVLPNEPSALAQAIKTVTGSKALMAKLRAGAISLAPCFEWSSIVLQLFGDRK